jgi:pilus assembly protein CpaF
MGGVPPGLVQRVQQRLAAAGGVATDTAGLRKAVSEALNEDGVLLPSTNLAPIVRAIGDELTGLGPLAPLLADPTVTDVLVNGPTDVWVERAGTIERAAVRFASAAAVATLVQRVVAPLGLRVDESRPWVDARLPGGERFHAVLPPLAPDGPVVTIRTFARRRLQLCDLIERGALDTATARLLEAMVAAGIAIAVSGATGTGKTTLLNVLAAAIPAHERIVTIEDVAELCLPGPHVVRLEARPPNVEGRGEVPLRELVRNALRMRPDRIVVGEVRGPEVLDMLQAANTGHRGLMTTLHAGGPEEVPARLEAMALAASGAGLDVVRRLVAGGIGAVVHLERAPTGHPTRRVTVVAELVTTDDDRAHAVPLRTATSATGLSATGHVPRWANRLDPSVLPPSSRPTSPAGSESSAPGATSDDSNHSHQCRRWPGQGHHVPPDHDGRGDNPAAHRRRCGPDRAGPVDAVPEERVAPGKSKAAGSRNGLGSRVDMGKVAETPMAIGLPGVPESQFSASSSAGSRPRPGWPGSWPKEGRAIHQSTAIRRSTPIGSGPSVRAASPIRAAQPIQPVRSIRSTPSLRLVPPVT